eukprot:gene14691-biopygen3614
MRRGSDTLLCWILAGSRPRRDCPRPWKQHSAPSAARRVLWGTVVCPLAIAQCRSRSAMTMTARCLGTCIMACQEWDAWGKRHLSVHKKSEKLAIGLKEKVGFKFPGNPSASKTVSA